MLSSRTSATQEEKKEMKGREQKGGECEKNVLPCSHDVNKG